jgi:hypothetical protein
MRNADCGVRNGAETRANASYRFPKCRQAIFSNVVYSFSSIPHSALRNPN